MMHNKVNHYSFHQFIKCKLLFTRTQVTKKCFQFFLLLVSSIVYMMYPQVEYFGCLTQLTE